MDKSEVSFHWR